MPRVVVVVVVLEIALDGFPERVPAVIDIVDLPGAILLHERILDDLGLRPHALLLELCVQDEGIANCAAFDLEVEDLAPILAGDDEI